MLILVSSASILRTYNSANSWDLQCLGYVLNYFIVVSHQGLQYCRTLLYLWCQFFVLNFLICSKYQQGRPFLPLSPDRSLLVDGQGAYLFISWCVTRCPISLANCAFAKRLPIKERLPIEDVSKYCKTHRLQTNLFSSLLFQNKFY